jgi:tripartite-type tricarboxylate transporter receptor subunit TctC
MLSAASQKLASEPAYQAKIAGMGAEATSSSSDELVRFVPTQINAWGALVRKLGIKP